MSEIRIETLGCRLNQIESESAAKLFTDKNFSVSMQGITSSSEEDLQTLVCIINTCTVTQKAEQKARRLIRLILKKKTGMPAVLQIQSDKRLFQLLL